MIYRTALVSDPYARCGGGVKGDAEHVDQAERPAVKAILLLRSVDSRWAFHVLEGDSAILGRAPGADLLLADQTVARKHARIVDRDGHWYIEDLRSHCGVVVNGLQAHGVRELRAGDLLRIGRVEFLVDVATTAVENQ